MQPPLATFLEQVLATAQAGLTYSKDPFDIGRFEALRAATVALIASHSDLKPDAIAEWIDLDRGYPTPKLDVRALIVDKAGHILLVQERSDGCWTLPGGWCDIGDSPADAVVCEVTGGQLLGETDETQGAGYFPIDDLPELSLHRVVEPQLRTLHAHLLQGWRDTLFD